MFNTKKEIKKLNEKIDALCKLIETNEIAKIKRENEILRNKEDLIKKIKFSVKDARIIDDPETTKRFLRISYTIPSINVEIDPYSNEIIEENPVFKAINYLDCISFEDMKKIKDALEK